MSGYPTCDSPLEHPSHLKMLVKPLAMRIDPVILLDG